MLGGCPGLRRLDEPSEKESIKDSKMLGVGDVAEGTENRSVGDEKT